jgi:hypothetical protein
MMPLREPIDLVGYYEFWGMATKAMVSHMLCILRHGSVLTEGEIVAVINTIPMSASALKDESWKAAPFYQCCTRAFNTAQGTDGMHVRESVAWFIGYFVARTMIAKEMLRDTLAGCVPLIVELRRLEEMHHAK